MRAFAIRIPYPPPPNLASFGSLPGMPGALERAQSLGRIVDFPERHISYGIVCDQTKLEECFRAVLEAVALLPRGQEPARLELRPESSSTRF